MTLGGLAGQVGVLGGIVTPTAGFSFGVIWRYLTTIIIGLLLGQLIFRALNSPTEENRWLPMVLGWLIKLAIVLFGLGAIWIWGLDLLRKPSATEAAAEV